MNGGTAGGLLRHHDGRHLCRHLGYYKELQNRLKQREMFIA